MARLHRVQHADDDVGADRRLLRLLRQAEAKHHIRVPHWWQEHAYLPHRHVHDCQVPKFTLFLSKSKVKLWLNYCLFIWVVGEGEYHVVSPPQINNSPKCSASIIKIKPLYLKLMFCFVTSDFLMVICDFHWCNKNPNL